jgi:hypothetical protein
LIGASFECNAAQKNSISMGLVPKIAFVLFFIAIGQCGEIHVPAATTGFLPYLYLADTRVMKMDHNENPLAK